MACVIKGCERDVCKRSAKVCCVIPARGQSRRIPRKNIKLFYGKPIISYSIETAQKSGLFDRIIVSTEDEEIAEIAKEYGAEVMMRSAEMSCNEIGTQAVIANVLRNIDCQYACGIYATSPLMTADDLLRGLNALDSYGADFAMSVCESPLSDAGQWYWGRREAFISGTPLIAEGTIMVPIPPERVCDINVESDWMKAEIKFKELHGY